MPSPDERREAAQEVVRFGDLFRAGFNAAYDAALGGASWEKQAARAERERLRAETAEESLTARTAERDGLERRCADLRAALGGEGEKLRQLLCDVAMESSHGQEKLSDKTYGRVLDALHDFPTPAEHPETGEREAQIERVQSAIEQANGAEPEFDARRWRHIAEAVVAVFPPEPLQDGGERIVLWTCSRCERVERMHDGDERPECCGKHVSLGERAEQEHEPTPMLAVPYLREAAI